MPKQSGPGNKLKKILQNARAIRNVVGAATKLSKQVADPRNVYKSIREKGLTLPGSNYIGPGNSLNKGKPTDRGDAIALQHDKDYDQYLKSGKRAKAVYTRYSRADARALRRAWKAVKKDGDAGALAVAVGMGVKALGAKLGVLKRLD